MPGLRGAPGLQGAQVHPVRASLRMAVQRDKHVVSLDGFWPLSIHAKDLSRLVSDSPIDSSQIFQSTNVVRLNQRNSTKHQCPKVRGILAGLFDYVMP
jgi:hypothetical protein